MRADLPFLFQGGMFFTLLFLASVFDIRKRTIPDTVCLLIALTGLISFEPVKLFGILTAIPLLLAALLWGGMGGGDIKLTAASGIVLSLQRGLAAMVIGLTALLLFYLIYSIVQKLRKRKRQKAFPLAPFLSVGCIAAYFLNGGIIL
ncbi:MAG TPA: prepilin peptidase [Ruminococcaceae bacterium]|jgi:leader peptidase (prepilin peptidase)/N-methyltransferase|nr:prepilin peptidase [Oscillospiraceae bacterium]HCM23972.1 prepilin peptidase [Oscillospiraceae bacterium]